MRGGFAGWEFPASESISAIPAGAFEGAESDGMGAGMVGDGVSPHRLIMPVFEPTEQKGGGGLEAEACAGESTSDGGASISGSGARRTRRAAAQSHADENKPQGEAK